jgi:hypothetical protein
MLCVAHHAQLRRHLAVFGAPPATWTSLRPRRWVPVHSSKMIVLGPDDALRFLVSGDGEPVALPRGGGHFVGVDSSEIYPRAFVVERPKMAWLRRLAFERPDVDRALARAAQALLGAELTDEA